MGNKYYTKGDFQNGFPKKKARKKERKQTSFDIEFDEAILPRAEADTPLSLIL